MRLLNTLTKRLADFNDPIPDYAILSHTWGNDEVTFQDLQAPGYAENPSWRKIEGLCAQAAKDGIGWVWADTCCIDKTSSAELSEAINSMFRWYQESSRCYAYLSDVTSTGETVSNGKITPDEQCVAQFRASRWFARGWTLQELLAPTSVEFFSCKWTPIGGRTDLSSEIELITGIPKDYLLGYQRLSNASVAQRMSWAAARETTRREDRAYCLMGIFGVNMPMLYGEGDRAFIRLQEEILKESNDQSLLAWQPAAGWVGLSPGAGALALSPADFAGSKTLVPTPTGRKRAQGVFEMTKRGLFIELPILIRSTPSSPFPLTYGILNCWSTTDFTGLVAVPLEEDPETEDGYIRDRNLHTSIILCDTNDIGRARTRKIYINKPLTAGVRNDNWFSVRLGPGVPRQLVEVKPYRDYYSKGENQFDFFIQSESVEPEDTDGWRRTLIHFQGDMPSHEPMIGGFPGLAGPSSPNTKPREFTLTIFSRMANSWRRNMGAKQSAGIDTWCRITDSGIAENLQRPVDLQRRGDLRLKLSQDEEVLVQLNRRETLGQSSSVITITMVKPGEKSSPPSGEYFEVNPWAFGAYKNIHVTASSFTMDLIKFWLEIPSSISRLPVRIKVSGSQLAVGALFGSVGWSVSRYRHITLASIPGGLSFPTEEFLWAFDFVVILHFALLFSNLRLTIPISIGVASLSLQFGFISNELDLVLIPVLIVLLAPCVMISFCYFLAFLFDVLILKL